MSGYQLPKSVQVTVCGTPFNLNKDLLAEKSSTLYTLFKENPDEDLSHLLSEYPTAPQIFKLVVRFFYGFKINFTPENIIPISCFASYLGMTDSHSPNNLLNQALSFFEREIITGWNESLRSLKVIENTIVFQQAEKLGLIDACVGSIINKALDNPLLLGEPIKNPVLGDDQELDGNVLEWKSEDLSLTTLHLEFYEPIIQGMIQSEIGLNFIASNLYQYAKRRVFLDPKEDTSCSSEGVCSKSRKVVIETIERLLPHDRGILPCALLSEMLQHATLLEANANCREGFEVRIGRQLDLATVNDLLLILSSSQKGGYYSSSEEKYDTECVGRILKHFYYNFTGQDEFGLDIVAELVENFLVEVASDINLKKDAFLSLAGISIAASDGTQRSSGGIFRAIDIYLNKHKYLTESERLEVCGVLNFNKTSPKQTVQKKRYPGHVVMHTSMDGIKKSMSKSMEDDEKEELKVTIEKLRCKVTELEKELLVMRKETQRGYCSCMKMKTDKEKSMVLAGEKEEAWVNIEPQRLQLLCQGEEEGSSSVEDEEDFEFV